MFITQNSPFALAPTNPMAVHFSSEDTEWETPDWLYSRLDGMFHFDVDLCATQINKKCPNFISPQDDSFRQEWKGTCWLNPPYGRGVDKWIKKAVSSAVNEEATVVALLPARTETKWFQHVWTAPFIVFLAGRLQFKGAPAVAPFPSCLAIFSRNLPPDLNISDLALIGNVVHTLWRYEPAWALAPRKGEEVDEDGIVSESDDSEELS